MPITIIVDLRAQPGKVEDVSGGLTDLLPDTRSFDGCLAVRMVRDQDDPTHLLLVERWTDRSSQERYLAWRAETGTLNALAEALAAPPTFTFFDELLEL